MEPVDPEKTKKAFEFLGDLDISPADAVAIASRLIEFMDYAIWSENRQQAEEAHAYIADGGCASKVDGKLGVWVAFKRNADAKDDETATR